VRKVAAQATSTTAAAMPHHCTMCLTKPVFLLFALGTHGAVTGSGAPGGALRCVQLGLPKNLDNDKLPGGSQLVNGKIDHPRVPSGGGGS
jgi:hypothetical protein